MSSARRGAALALALGAGITLSACETTQEKSHALEVRFHREQARLKASSPSARGLQITSPSRFVKVLSARLVRGREGTAAVVTLRSSAAKPLRDIPLAIALTGAGGGEEYSNEAPGLEAALVSLSLIEPHRATVWIDDQIPASGHAVSVTARVGEGSPAASPVPAISTRGVKLLEGGELRGTVVNRSAVAQQDLVVYAVARSGGRMVAAGRAIVAILPAHGSQEFEIFMVGDPQGARIAVSAPPTTLP